MNIQGYEFDINELVNYLKKYKSKLDMLYNWDSPKDKDIVRLFNMEIISEEESNLLLENNKFERNIIFRKLFEKTFKTSSDNNHLDLICNWIVRDWGGIYGFKDDNPYDRVLKFKKEVENFSVNDVAIASMSKILSFIEPQKYAIFDSRAAYTLNWLISKFDAADKFFNLPQGRNTKMNAFDINTLIHLKKVSMFNIKDIDKLNISKIDKEIYIPHKKTYPVFTELIQVISSKLWVGDKERQRYPYYTEMILFSISDTYIIKDIMECYSK